MMLQPNDLQVEKITTEQQLGADGRLHDMLHITFMVREHGPFYLDAPADSFNGQDVKARLVMRATEILSLFE